MHPSLKIRRLCSRLSSLADSIDRSVPGTAAEALDLALSRIEADLLLAEGLAPAPAEQPRGRMLVDVTTGRRGRRMF
jgi:hypothetical protein